MFYVPLLCVYLGTIFLNTGGTELSQVCGKTVTVRVHVCPQEKNKFHFMWQCNNVNFPKENGFSLTFEALTTAYCVCIAVNPSSRKEVDRSVVFEVLPTGASASSSQSHTHTHSHHMLHTHTHTTCYIHTHSHTHTHTLTLLHSVMSIKVTHTSYFC